MRTLAFSAIIISFFIVQGCASSQSKEEPRTGNPAMATTQKSDPNMELLMQKVKADKKLLVAKNMQLTDAEAQRFWPIYDAYQQDLGKINQRLNSTIMEYADAYNNGAVTNSKAEKLLTQAIDTEEAEVNLRQSYVDTLGAALPATKVARYIQIENKIRAAVKGSLAEMIPLVY